MSSPAAAIIAVDAGTSALRVVGFDLEGRRLAHFSRASEVRRDVDGTAEQDPLLWAAAMRDGLREVGAALAGREVAAIAVTSQRASVVAVDAAGEPVHPALLWRDRRGGADAERFGETLGPYPLYERTGLRTDSYFTAPKLSWLARSHPAAAARASWYLSVQDYLVQQLSGEVGTDWTQASRTLLFDIEVNRWDPDLVDTWGLDPRRLPPTDPPGSTAGALRSELARETGLPSGIPVVRAGGDQQCGLVGLGVVAGGSAGVTVSSGSFLLAPVGHPCRDRFRRILCSPSAVPGQWVLEGGSQTAMSSVSWMLRTLGQGDPEVAIEAALAESPPGARDVVVLPHFNGIAAPYWDPRARGAIVGLSEAHQPADLIRADLEGIAIDVRRNLRVLAPLLDDDLVELRAGGGGARSDRFLQLQADVYRMPLAPVREPEAAALGAAIQGAIATGRHRDHQAAAAAMVHPDESRRARPREELGELYEELVETHERLLDEIWAEPEAEPEPAAW
ncbi:MAG: FGGY-family carbohydrate kinase [Solirubrobacterales bacterium]